MTKTHSPPPKVSVIVPVYNAAAYLDACIDSVLKQSVEEIEVICVDDCSTDSSGEVLARRAAGDDRLVVLRHPENLGAGAARNTGLDAARGEFVFHLDADDTLPVDALTVLYNEASANCSDMAKGGYALMHPDGRVEANTWSLRTSRVANTNIRESRFLQGIPTGHWSYLYRREFLDAHGIRYQQNLLVGLDLIFDPVFRQVIQGPAFGGAGIRKDVGRHAARNVSRDGPHLVLTEIEVTRIDHDDEQDADKREPYRKLYRHRAARILHEPTEPANHLTKLAHTQLLRRERITKVFFSNLRMY